MLHVVLYYMEGWVWRKRKNVGLRSLCTNQLARQEAVRWFTLVIRYSTQMTRENVPLAVSDILVTLW
jgi:hypothetical protein